MIDLIILINEAGYFLIIPVLLHIIPLISAHLMPSCVIDKKFHSILQTIVYCLFFSLTLRFVTKNKETSFFHHSFYHHFKPLYLETGLIITMQEYVGDKFLYTVSVIVKNCEWGWTVFSLWENTYVRTHAYLEVVEVVGGENSQ